MSEQLTVRLPADLAEELERAAKRLRRNRSDVVRLALEQYLAGGAEERPIHLVRDLLGQVESGIPDLGEQHREYLVKRLRHGR
jgi:Arc/MetJ-type ribon-helix-helix transcriptional regulator